MKARTLLLAFLSNAFVIVGAFAQALPLVYDVENTGADCPAPPLPAFGDLPATEALPDPFAWSDPTRGRITSRSDWRCRRAEILAEIQAYEVGNKPAAPASLLTTLSEDTVLTVIVRAGANTLRLTARVVLPAGDGPFPAVIGVGFGGTGSLPADIFTRRGIATIQFNQAEIGGNDVFGSRGVGPFYRLYPGDTGKFAAWAWGISRIIDGLEARPELNIDLSKLGVTGCSFAGKIALFSGAFDERIALTIAQEPGGGGVAAWRVTEALPGERETLGRTTQGWFSSDLFQFSRDVEKLPFDHHELAAMVAPRALLVLGNPDYEWMAEESNHVSSTAAREVWRALGVPDRFGFSIVAGHPHCVLPNSQRPEVEAFVEKFLLGNEAANTTVSVSPYRTDLSSWITWETPELSVGTTAIEEPGTVIDRFSLLSNYPNPFQTKTTIGYTVRQSSHVALRVYNVLGQLVDTLVDDLQPSGTYSVVWEGRAVPAGMYFYRITVGGVESTRMMAYVR